MTTSRTPRTGLIPEPANLIRLQQYAANNLIKLIERAEYEGRWRELERLHNRIHHFVRIQNYWPAPVYEYPTQDRDKRKLAAKLFNAVIEPEEEQK